MYVPLWGEGIHLLLHSKDFSLMDHRRPPSPRNAERILLILWYIMICYDIIIDSMISMYYDIVLLLYIVSDALRYGYVVAVFSKKQKTGTKNLFFLFTSPLPCRSRWSSSRLSFASWKNPTASGRKWLGKLKKKTTWIQGKLQDQTWKLVFFSIIFVHSRQLNLWYWWGRNPWFTHQISSHFVGFQTGLRPGWRPSWEISLRIVSFRRSIRETISNTCATLISKISWIFLQCSQLQSEIRTSSSASCWETFCALSKSSCISCRSCCSLLNACFFLASHTYWRSHLTL